MYKVIRDEMIDGRHAIVDWYGDVIENDLSFHDAEAIVEIWNEEEAAADAAFEAQARFEAMYYEDPRDVY